MYQNILALEIYKTFQILCAVLLFSDLFHISERIRVVQLFIHIPISFAFFRTVIGVIDNVCMHIFLLNCFISITIH